MNNDSRDFTIQDAGWRDLKPLQHLEKVCFDLDAWPLIELLGVLTFPGVVRLKAVANGKMVGFIAGDRRKNESLAVGKLQGGAGWILTLGVLPQWRRNGIAEGLLAECEQQLAMPLVKLTVRRNNTSAINLYKKTGYSQVDIWSHYYRNGEDGLVFEKQMEDENALE